MCFSCDQALMLRDNHYETDDVIMGVCLRMSKQQAYMV